MAAVTENRTITFSVPSKDRPRKAFGKVMTAGGFKMEQPADRIDEGVSFVDPENKNAAGAPDFPLIDTVYMRCQPALVSIVKDMEGKPDAVKLAVVGRDTLEEFNAEARRKGTPQVTNIVGVLPVAECRLSLIVREDSGIRNIQDLSGKEVATKYPASLEAWLDKNGVQNVTVVKIDGNAELFAKRKWSDAVCDIVETGNSIRANNLRVLDAAGSAGLTGGETGPELVKSSSVLVRTGRRLSDAQEDLMTRFVDYLVESGRLVKAAADKKKETPQQEAPQPLRRAAMRM